MLAAPATLATFASVAERLASEVAANTAHDLGAAPVSASTRGQQPADDTAEDRGSDGGPDCRILVGSRSSALREGWIGVCEGSRSDQCSDTDDPHRFTHGPTLCNLPSV